MNAPTVGQIVAAMERHGHVVFRDARGHDLNLVGVRSEDMTANTFNDWLTVFYIFDGRWNFFAFPATTDPGTYWRENLANVDGSAILKPGQYRHSHQRGLHRGDEALVQRGPLTVYRDANRDGVLDVTGVPEDTGMFGIDIHRANSVRPSVQVDRWSAGCQVVQDPDHFAFLMTLSDRAVEKYGNSFSYTLLTEGDL